MIRLVIADNDGCLGNYAKFGRPLEEDLKPHTQDFDRIRDFLSAYPVMFAMNTGRSLTNSAKIMHEVGMNAPSALEMGTLVYNPRTHESHILAYTEGFKDYREAQDEVRRFHDYISKSNGKLDDIFGCDASFLSDRKNMICIEVAGKTGYDIDPIVRRMMKDYPDLENLEREGKVLLVPSKGAIDIMPAIGKGKATEYQMDLCGVSRDESLSIGDSDHTDRKMMKKTGLVGCPSNADPATKKYVASRGKEGHISDYAYAEGVLDTMKWARAERGFG